MALGNATILVIDDDRDILTAARYLLERHYRQVLTCFVPDEIPALLQRAAPDLILLDMNFQPGASDGAQGLLWLERIIDADPDAVVVMIMFDSPEGRTPSLRGLARGPCCPVPRLPVRRTPDRGRGSSRGSLRRRRC